MTNLEFGGIYSPPHGNNVALEFVRYPDTRPRPWRGATKSITVHSTPGVSVSASVITTWQQSATQSRRTIKQHCLAAIHVAHITATVWQPGIPISRHVVDHAQTASGLARTVSIDWMLSQRIRAAMRSHWKRAWQVSASVLDALANATPVSLVVSAHWQPSQRMAVIITDRYQAQRMASRSIVAMWQRARAVPHVWPRPATPDIPVSPGTRIYIPPVGSAVALNFECALESHIGGVALSFRARQCTPRPAILKVYLIMTDISLVRLPDRVPVPISSVQVRTDADSWCWDFSATVTSRAALDLVRPDAGPVAVEASINGHTFTAMVESWRESRSHGKSGYTITGRSLSAELAAPYAATSSYTETADRTAHQLADAAMLNTGFTVDWSTVDWLVTAGAYSYRDASPMAAIQQVAEAVGAIVQTSRNTQHIAISPRYPTSPWGWAAATPVVVVTDDLCRSLGTNWQTRPAFDGVYVSGTTQGVVALVKRTGTAGANLAPMITDPLITHADAARERGRNTLSAAGKWSVTTIDFPLLPTGQAPGLLAVGDLIEVFDGYDLYRAQVRSVGINAQRGNGSISVVQSVEVERYHG